MAREEGERWECEACGTHLVGALTIKRKVAPIEVLAVDPTEENAMKGNVWLGRNSDGEVICATLSGELLAQATEAGIALHLNHFATCKDAMRFSRG